MGFRQVGIKVFQGVGTLVGDVVESYHSGSAISVDERNSCQGGGGGQGQGQGHCGSRH
jgi:predicted Fe-Mo cluster-binding NifX family protein